jgi:hypothetical protein
MKLPYWLQPGSQQFIDYMELVNEMDYPNGIYGKEYGVYPNRDMAHRNALRCFKSGMPLTVPRVSVIVEPSEITRLCENAAKATNRGGISADIL